MSTDTLPFMTSKIHPPTNHTHPASAALHNQYPAIVGPVGHVMDAMLERSTVPSAILIDGKPRPTWTLNWELLEVLRAPEFVFGLGAKVEESIRTKRVTGTRSRSKVSREKSGDADTKVEPKKKGKGKAAAVSQLLASPKKPTMEGK